MDMDRSPEKIRQKIRLRYLYYKLNQYHVDITKLERECNKLLEEIDGHSSSTVDSVLADIDHCTLLNLVRRRIAYTGNKKLST